MARTVLITGGVGFLGSHIADALAAGGCGVRILDNLEKEVHDGRWPSYVRGKGYELVRGDVREKRDWTRVLPGVDYVCHFAAYQDQRTDFSTFFQTNTVSTALLYECVVNSRLPVKRILLASSQYVYGDGAYEASGGAVFYPELRAWSDLRRKRFEILGPDGTPARFLPFREDQPVTPTNSYGLSKYALEMLALRLGKTYGLRTRIARYSIIQGERQSPRNLYSGALRIFVSQALAGVPITVYEDGRQMRDFANVHDAVRANLLLLRAPGLDYEVFNVGGGTGVRVIDFAEQVRRITGTRSQIRIGGARRTDTRHAVSDISKIGRLGWRPIRTMEDSIRGYVEWYRGEGFDKTADAAALRALRKGIRT